MIKTRVIPTGALEANTIIINSNKGNAIVDPGGPEILDFLKKPINYILLTHAHIDHIAGVLAVKEKFPEAKILLGAKDFPLYERFDLQAKLFHLPAPDYLPKPDTFLVGGEEILEFKVIPAPGHSPGSMVFYHPQGVLITGDVLFRLGVGRTDLWEGDWKTLLNTINNLLNNLPLETKVLPGHGPLTTLIYEKQHNPFLT